MELKILIVDDEEIIRDGIANKIRRHVPHAVVVGKAQDAGEGLELIKTCKPNIIITDICMPEMDGIEFIKRAREMDANLKFIIVSGYQDFGYAKSAISLGVVEYLLKPIDNEQLKGIIHEIERKMEEEAGKESVISSLSSKVKTSVDLLRNKYLSDIINHTGEFDIQQILEKLDTIEVRFAKPHFTVMSIVISCFEEQSNFVLEKDLPLLKFSVRNIAEELLAPLGIVAAFDNLKYDRQVVVFINHDQALHTVNNMQIGRLSREIIFAMNKYFKVSVSIGVGKSCNSCKDIPNSFMQSYIAVLQRIIQGDNRVIHFDEVNDLNRITFFLTDEQKLKLVNYIREGNLKRSTEIIDGIFEHIGKKNIPYSNIRVLFIDLFLMLSKTVKEAGGSWDKIFKEDIFSENYFLQCTSLKDIRNLINENIARICSYVSDLTKSEGKKVIDEIKEYIDQYYYSEVSLTDLANKYYLNSNYLGQLFKSEIGENFVDYLTKKRIEKSVDLLLNTEFQAYKIAQMVGYVNPRYFCDVFKRVIGTTPSQFRQQNGMDVN